jgi:hypothetical protein
VQGSFQPPYLVFQPSAHVVAPVHGFQKERFEPRASGIAGQGGFAATVAVPSARRRVIGVCIHHS